MTDVLHPLAASLGLSALLGSAACVASDAPGTLDAPLRLDGGGPAHLFATDEPVTFRLAGASGPARWELTDWQGETLAQGEIAAADGGRIDLPLTRQGYFELKVSQPDQPVGEPAREAIAAFTRLPRLAPRHDGPFGVMTHFAQGWDRELVPMMARIGLGQVRDEQYWAEVEREPGRYGFPADYVAYMTALRREGITPLLEMTFANPHYDAGTTPTSPAAQAAYARYGVALLDAYGDQVPALEVWNEINGSWCDGACRDDRVGTYAGMLAASWRAVKTRDPGVTIVGGGSAAIALPWFRQLAERGAFAHLDALAAHSYAREPEDVLPELEGLVTLARSTAPERALPVWITEAGLAIPVDDAAGRRKAAAWLVRLLTVLRAGGADRVYWYLLRDDGPFQGMGLLRGPDSPYGHHAPNPAYAAYATLIHLLDGTSHVGRDATDARTQAHLFAQDGRSVRVLWSSNGWGRLDYRAQAPLDLVDLMGNATRLVPRDGRVSVELAEVPRYLVGPATLEREYRPDRLIADSRLDFSIVPDIGTWSYGYRRWNDAKGELGPILPMVPAEDAWGAGWAVAAGDRLALQRDQAHPAGTGPDAEQVWIVRRWRSGPGGEMRLSGTIERPAPQGDGVEVLLLVDGEIRQRWRLAPGERVDYAIEAALQPGSMVDLVVTPGPAGEDSFDATVTTLTVTSAAPAMAAP